ncbi:MAG: electron transport complex subunit E [Clostridium sp.]|uniref:electron transport complex subunit RsxE n=1 Tax=Clostridium sp. TaxID=1506 RepID=UPI0025BCFCC2|nr:electron transport complex subunit E [Clostridium sp.]MCF0147251.1 electron transport complex subunit E [Clostridium sp.]
MNKCTERIYNGVIKENPTFVMMLGLCPTMAVTTAAINGVGMGLSTTAVLVASNLLISMLRKVIPDKVRMPAYIVIVASFVTVVEMLLEAYFYESLYKSLGIYIPLIVVNCIILGRAEAYAAKNDVVSSIFDGIGMGLGFTLGLLVIGAVREIIGSGQAFGLNILPSSYEPVSIFVLAPGAFFVIAFLTALQNKFNAPSATNKKKSEESCTSSCAGCTLSGCSSKIEMINGIDEGGK